MCLAQYITHKITHLMRPHRGMTKDAVTTKRYLEQTLFIASE